MKRMRWQAAFALMALVAVVRADFVPPAEGPVPFRRDRLPVDVDTMGTLSRQVLAMSGAKLPPGAAGSRAVAQIAALALALDPANRQARELIETIQAGGRPERVAGKELERTLSRARQVLGWLELPEAGPDGQALAACLGDLLAVADPEHPGSMDRLAAGEQGAWKDWIAPEEAFGKKPEPSHDDPADPDGKGKPKPAVATIALPEVNATMPVWVTDKLAEKIVLEVVQVHLSATPAEEGEGLTLGFSSKPAADANADSAKEVEAFLTRRHGSNGPITAVVSFDKTKTFIEPLNGGSLSGTAALLGDGALSGKPPTASALAVVGKGGKLEMPPHLWQTLRALAEGNTSGRLILPASAADHLTGLLVLDQAAFFMRYEVLLAETVDELCDLGSATVKPETADAFARFAEIHKVGAAKPVGSFVAHPATQARLRELVAVMPQHASARLLALQGSTTRPRFLARPLLAREIRDALLPIGELESVTTDKLIPKRLTEIHELCRAKLDTMGSIIDIRDRDLHKSAVAVADSVRTLARLMDKSDDYDGYSHLSKQIATHKETWREYVTVLTTLTQTAGDQAEFTVPKVTSVR
ncbi:hypothetical protein [Luteolibacter sp. Populi]|uniref:hypothetical protein n=1 Tax=Luteolibacter sp. Populi TaxID=3230487 RepID=UPI00346642EE